MGREVCWNGMTIKEMTYTLCAEGFAECMSVKERHAKIFMVRVVLKLLKVDHTFQKPEWECDMMIFKNWLVG